MTRPNFSTTWLHAIAQILESGKEQSPRGINTLEHIHATIVVNTRCPVLWVPARKLNYKFMGAEAYWILSGDNRVETIAPYNSNIAKFSDDGKVFAGAYGPKILSQFTYVVDKLLEDPSTRQAVMTIWRENPTPSKDIPCTVAISFTLRDGELNAHVLMRSNDIWLGTPYDVFNFSMLVHAVCAAINEHPCGFSVVPGLLFLTAASLHLYETNKAAAEECLASVNDGVPVLAVNPRPTPTELFTDTKYLMGTLEGIKWSAPGDNVRWWERLNDE